MPSTTRFTGVPAALDLSPSGQQLLVALPDSNQVVQLDLSTGLIEIAAGDPRMIGDGGPATAAAVASPFKLALDSAGNLYVADQDHNRIRVIAPGAAGTGTGTISTVIGTGAAEIGTPGLPAGQYSLFSPQAVFVDSSGRVYSVTSGCTIVRMDADGTVRYMAGGLCGFADGPASSARFRSIEALTMDAQGVLYIADMGNHAIRKLDTNGVTTIAGTGTAGYSGDGGPATAAMLNYPYDLLLDGRGGLLIADAYNRRVRRIDLATGIIRTVVGNGSFYSGDGTAVT